jgi:putative membrane protein
MKTKSLSVVALSAALAAALCLPAFDVAAAAADDGQPGKFSKKDYKFVCETAKGGNLEMELSRLAVAKGNDASVRDFAQRMVTDHEKTAQELKELAAAKGATLPTVSALDKKETKMKDELAGLSGKEFDRAYMRMMLRDHGKDVRAFKKQSDKAEDSMLKAWATKTLALLREHMQSGEAIHEKIAPAVTQTPSHYYPPI